MRGIIATVAQINTFNDGFSFNTQEGGLSENDIKYFLLYWDKIVIPSNNLFYAGVPYEKDLIASEIIERPMLSLQGSFSSSNLGKILLDGESKIVEKKMEDKKINWTIHQFNEKLILPDSKRKEKDIFKFDLINALPVPLDKINIHEIIEFKERRKDEFIALHDTLDKLYFDIIKSPDSDFKASNTMKTLNIALEDIEKVQKEKFKIFSKYDLTTELNINGKDILNGIVAGGIIDWRTGTQIPFGTILGGIAPMIKISLKKTTTFSGAENKLNLAYLSRAKKEKII